MACLLFFVLYLLQYDSVYAKEVPMQKIALSKVNNSDSNLKYGAKNTDNGAFEMGVSNDFKSSSLPISTELYDALMDIDLRRISKESLPSQQDLLSNMKKNSIINLTSAYIPIFREYLLPYIKKPCVLLLTARNDITIPEELYADDVWGKKYGHERWVRGVRNYVYLLGDSGSPIPLSDLCRSKKDCQKRKDFEALLENKYIKHLFVTNLDYPSHPKLSSLPIGVSCVATEGRNRIMDFNYLRLKRTNQRHQKVFADANFAYFKNHPRHKHWRSKGYQVRAEVIKIFKDDKRKEFTFTPKNRLEGEEYWTEKSKYAFALSPIGHGMDCYRTYESIIAGQIVITQSSPLNKMYKELGLPVIIVDDYKEVTAEKLKEWLEMYPDVMTNDNYRNKIKRQYWEDRIKSHFDE